MSRDRIHCESCHCGVDRLIPEPDVWELDAAKFFFDQTVVALRGGHRGDHGKFTDLMKDVQRAMGHAAAEFKRRYVCAG